VSRASAEGGGRGRGRLCRYVVMKGPPEGVLRLGPATESVGVCCKL
jgi:hypothetical protein